MATTNIATPKGAKTPLEMFYHWEASAADRRYASQPIDGEWNHYTWGEFADEVRRMAAYLMDQGWEPNTKVALASKNCVHWLMTDLAIQLAGYISVPIYPNVSAETVEYVLTHSESKMLFIGKLDDVNWNEMKNGVPEGMPTVTFPRYGQPGHKVWDEIMEEYEPFAGSPERNPRDVMTIIYTSGTTGKPKGVVQRFEAPVDAIYQFRDLFDLNPGDRFFSYLPLSHIAERMLISLGTLICGGTVHFAESLQTFNDNLKTCQPTIFLGVPRIWTKFQMGVLAKFPPSRLNLLLKIPILNNVIRGKIQEALGLDKGRVLLTGAAPIPTSLLKWYENLNMNIYEVYGMTENCACCTTNRPGAIKYGTVGKPLDNVEIKLTEEGEICARSKVNMAEYYKEPDKTDETMIDDWLHTGDLGEIDADGFVRITGRVKDIFKTSKAKYVAPNPIELKLSENELIEQVAVVGTGIPQPIALVVLSESGQKQARNEVQSSLESTLNDVNPRLEHHEQLQKIVVIDEPWTPENGVLTPSLKIKRNEVDKRFGKHYENWYEGGRGVAWEKNS